MSEKARRLHGGLKLNSRIVKEVSCRTALQPSGLRGLRYTINPYRGCLHSCIYCFSPAILREKREWGTFLEVRRNMPAVLARELKKGKFRKGVVAIGTVTDAYQSFEERYNVTRLCLEQLARHDWPVSVQTKSSLIERDIDVLTSFSKADVGMTVTVTDRNGFIRQLEPGASSYSDRISTLGKLSAAGLETWAYIAPMIPVLTGTMLGRIIEDLDGAGVRTVMIDKLRERGNAFERVTDALMEHLPKEEMERTRVILSTAGTRAAHFREVSDLAVSLCRRRGMRIEVYADEQYL